MSDSMDNDGGAESYPKPGGPASAGSTIAGFKAQQQARKAPHRGPSPAQVQAMALAKSRKSSAGQGHPPTFPSMGSTDTTLKTGPVTAQQPNAPTFRP